MTTAPDVTTLALPEDASPVSPRDRVDAFGLALASLREQVGTGSRSPVEEDLQRLSNRRYHLSLDFKPDRQRLEAIVADHHRRSPQLRLRVLGSS
jgi:hypothetical protein